MLITPNINDHKNDQLFRSMLTMYDTLQRNVVLKGEEFKHISIGEKFLHETFQS